MLDMPTIAQIARKAVVAHTGRAAEVADVQAAQTIDLDGRDALKITILLGDGAYDAVRGAAPLNTLVQINQDLQQAGESRFAFLEYNAVSEMDDIADH